MPGRAADNHNPLIVRADQSAVHFQTPDSRSAERRIDNSPVAPRGNAGWGSAQVLLEGELGRLAQTR